MGTFAERTLRLEEEVGGGKITAGIVVHQPYAADEHVERHYKHPRGGKSHYIEDPFFHDLNDNLRSIARNVVTPEGSDLFGTMKDIAESFDRALKFNAPVEFNTLRESGNVYVAEGSRKVWEKHQRARFRADKE
jgi:hypothetical protein